ncbi:pyrroline-5-carboxylate reductase [Lapidilactobacillus achengensis]|uniref:Pyrroline-5-carboxylate reductase n=1 Tax=Lapidilactobacillus achengensis TaxID=2486000 RepID=A0ABW1ULL0_9LACO|nr:pyrroline-5-carboxylate reductase [Lapidilactobacillus achengensis]
MSKTIGIIGGGNMGRAIMAGLIKAQLYPADAVLVYDLNPAALTTLQTELGVQPMNSAAELVATADVVVIAVKPQVIDRVLTPLRASFRAEQLLISIAAGVTLAHLGTVLDPKLKLVRVMPNTPALVGAGMAGVAVNSQVTAAEQATVLAIFNSFGRAQLVPEDLIDAVVGLSGSGPAYVYLFLEALADGAVAEGMPRQLAYEFAAQTVYGAAKMVLSTEEHPGVLKDMVCSPGGTTIAAVEVLEEHAFRGIVMAAVHAATEKNRQLG